MNNNIEKHSISLYVNNKPGVLIRTSLVFARRGYNIDSLVVSNDSNNPKFSRMNIEATGDTDTLHLMLAQLNRLVDVIHARDLSGEDILQKELSLVKLECPIEKRTELLQIAEAFSAKTIDLTENTITFQIAGSSEKLNRAETLLHGYKIKEIVRTGKVLMTRGEEATA
ncbi:MAG: acetolactate synthase small subunit [Spirochaetaceae bacterium]|jgi:acetolactate synthase-1/3 small subunit|nr:acetolactate synthase small subunit [Spirochaetaceae bacterium]